MADRREGRLHPNGLNFPEPRKGREIHAAILAAGFSIAILFCVAVFSPKDYALSSLPTTVALIFLGTFFGTLVDRLCLIVEEKRHVVNRYEGDKIKMLTSCFSGVRWIWLAPVTVVSLAILLINPAIEDLIVSICRGVITVPLVVRFFTSIQESKVEVSRIVEEKGKSVGVGLAWSFYFGYLDIILPKLEERIQTQLPDNHLSSEKLFVLLPLNCQIRNNISDADPQITEDRDGKDKDKGRNVKHVQMRGGLRRKFTNKVYCIEFEGRLYRVLLEYATTLDTLYQMGNLARIRAINEEEMVDQVKTFCQTLKGILKRPFNAEIQGKCEMVIYDPLTVAQQEGGLAGFLARSIEQAGGVARQRNGEEEADILEHGGQQNLQGEDELYPQRGEEHDMENQEVGRPRDIQGIGGRHNFQGQVEQYLPGVENQERDGEAREHDLEDGNWGDRQGNEGNEGGERNPQEHAEH